MRLIDADALKRWIETNKANANPLDYNTKATYAECITMVETMETIEAEPVVRCKDCMFARKVDSRREPKWKCVHSIWDGCTQWRESNFYCAYGEKNSAKMDLK